jgi:hypothetical protein
MNNEGHYDEEDDYNYTNTLLIDISRLFHLVKQRLDKFKFQYNNNWIQLGRSNNITSLLEVLSHSIPDMIIVSDVERTDIETINPTYYI